MLHRDPHRPHSNAALHQVPFGDCSQFFGGVLRDRNVVIKRWKVDVPHVETGVDVSLPGRAHISRKIRVHTLACRPYYDRTKIQLRGEAQPQQRPQVYPGNIFKPARWTAKAFFQATHLPRDDRLSGLGSSCIDFPQRF